MGPSAAEVRETLQQLRLTPQHFERTASGLTDTQLRRQPENGSWSVHEVLHSGGASSFVRFGRGMGGELKVLGAAEHNLRDVDVTFGPGVTAVVGVSGSGKSSLAFDVVYTEARRRFVESLALGRPGGRPGAARVRRIDGLGPAVAVAQHVLNRNPASTVATSVGLHPFFRILYARFAEVECPRCGVPVRSVSREERLALALEMLDDREVLDVEVAL